MVFLIQNTHSRRDSARTGLVRLEELTDDQLKELEGSFKAFRHKVLPGKNKTLDQFHTDDAACRGWGAQQSQTAGGWRYDMAYLQCMYAKGHQIPISGGPQPKYTSQSDLPNVPATSSESAPPVPPAGQPR